MKLKFITGVLLAFIMPIIARAETSSAYTKFDFDKSCKAYKEYELGVSAKCQGYKNYPVFFEEGDLRQSVRFGHIRQDARQWESFASFNQINNTIEWRLSKGEPFATILRWFIQGYDSETGDITKKDIEVLVVSTVGTAEKPVSCVVGYVNASSNKNANVLARKIADKLAPGFNCGTNTPIFHGKRGKVPVEPSRSFGEN